VANLNTAFVISLLAGIAFGVCIMCLLTASSDNQNDR